MTQPPSNSAPTIWSGFDLVDRAAIVRALYEVVGCAIHNARRGEPCWRQWPPYDHRPPVCQARAEQVISALTNAPTNTDANPEEK